MGLANFVMSRVDNNNGAEEKICRVKLTENLQSRRPNDSAIVVVAVVAATAYLKELVEAWKLIAPVLLVWRASEEANLRILRISED